MATKQPTSRAAKVFATLFVAAMLLLGAYGPRLLPSGGNDETTTTAEVESPAREVGAPIDVKSLPYYSPAWTFTIDRSGIEVQTDMYRDDEGREFGWTVCTLTWGSYPKKSVMVLAADGGPLAHRFDGPCERG